MALRPNTRSSPEETGTQVVRADAASGTRPLKGPERAAVLMLALGEQHGEKIWNLLDDQELRLVTSVMSALGTVEASVVEELMVEFVTRVSGSGMVMGNYEATERLLKRYLPMERVGAVMDEIRGPAGRNVWEKLSNVPEDTLANYLKNEYPQTISVVLSKLNAAQAAKILGQFPEEIATEVMLRMLKTDVVQKNIVDSIEQTLRKEFMSTVAHTRRRDVHEIMAEIFNGFDRQTEARFMSALEQLNRDSADRIKGLMFTFEDLTRLDAASAQTLMRSIDRDQLTVALKGASESARKFFRSNMSQRAAKMLTDDMEALGPVRLKDVDQAQTAIVNLAKQLAEKGEITISKGGSEEELVY
jgi:flagellar motor switch protein FliG